MEHLSGLAAFVRAAETRSFVAAARVLGLSPSAIGKSIGRLEARLGVRLFHRSTRSINLTEEGMQFFERCRQILDDLEDAQAALTKSTAAPRGRLRISVPAAGHRLLMPVLPSFRQAYPDVELDIDFSDRMVDVVDEGFDMVIRSGDLTDSRLHARRLCPFRFKLCGSPEYFARNGVPASPQDLQAHMCLRFRYPSSGKLQAWRLSEAGAEPVELRVPTTMTLGSIEGTLRAAIDGMGIAYLPDFVVDDAMQRQLLRTALEDTTSSKAASGCCGLPAATCYPSCACGSITSPRPWASAARSGQVLGEYVDRLILRTILMSRPASDGTNPLRCSFSSSSSLCSSM